MPNHCNTHDIDYPWQGQCPECRAIETAERSRRMLEQQEEARWEAREREWEQQRDQEVRHKELVRVRELEIYKRQNPGDYKCPECLYITLKRGASRCPACHAAIGHDHWPPIYENERLQVEEKARQEKLDAEEWARGEPERQRQAKALAEEDERRRMAAKQAAAAAAERANRLALKAEQKARRKNILGGTLAGISYGSGVGIVVGFFRGCSVQHFSVDSNTFGFTWLLCASIGAVIGLAVGYALGSKK